MFTAFKDRNVILLSLRTLFEDHCVIDSHKYKRQAT